MRIKQNKFLHAIASVFGVKRHERAFAAVVLAALTALNALVICKYYADFTPLHEHYWHLIVSKFHISGFDPITYIVVSDWTAGYNVFRHPLLAFYMYVPYLINQGLMWLTGVNCAIFIVAAMQMFCAFYSALFLRRILNEIVGVSLFDSNLLTAFFFSFAFVMITCIVPDHFVISMMLLLLSLYVSGRLMQKGKRLKGWQAALYFFVTAGTTLNNGLKIYLSCLFVNGRRIFRPKFLFGCILLPAALTWGAARLSYTYIVWPRDVAAKAARDKAKAARAEREKARQIAWARQDSVRHALGIELSEAQRDSIANDSARKARGRAILEKKRKRVKQGQPISQGEFMKWTDITTSRPESIVENLFGEAIQLHQDHLLGDTLSWRPIIVKYRYIINYAIEGVIVLLFLIGIWSGRRSKFFWLAMSYFALDIMLHVGLGFAINEIYIMAGHWMYVMPIAMAYTMRSAARRRALWLKGLTLALTLWLAGWNINLLVQYLYF